MVSCPDRRCQVCDGPMPEGRTSACSARCRARLSRQRKAQAIEAVLDEAKRKIRRVLSGEEGLRPDDFS